MNKKFHKTVLVPGVYGSDVCSAFHKYVLRSDWKPALEIVALIHTTGHANVLWNDIFCICARDIGPADPWLARKIFDHYDAWKFHIPDEHDASSSSESPLCFRYMAKAAKLLVEAPKCRLNENIQFIPDVTYDPGSVVTGFGSERTIEELERSIQQCVGGSLGERKKMVTLTYCWNKLLHLHDNQPHCCLQKDNEMHGMFKKHLKKYILNGLVVRKGKKFRPVARSFASMCEKAMRYNEKTWTIHFITWASLDDPPEFKSWATNPFTIASGLEKEPSIVSKTELENVFEDKRSKKAKGPWTKSGNEFPFPDYVYDKDTPEGVKRKRGIDHYYNEATKIIQPRSLDIETIMADPFVDDAFLNRQKEFSLEKKKQNMLPGTKRKNL